MSRMVSALFAHSPLLVLPLLGLCIFMTVFFAVVVRTMRRRATSFDAVASLPLADDDKPHGPSARVFDAHSEATNHIGSEP